MKKHLWTTLMLLLFVVSSTTASLGTIFNSEDGGAVIPVTKHGNLEMNFLIPDIYTKANRSLSLPLEINIFTNKDVVYSIQTWDHSINLHDLKIKEGTPYSISIKIGDYSDTKSAIW